MRKSPDITGKTFGSWTVLSRVKGPTWSCLCSCGRVQNTSGYNLRTGKSKKCRHCCKNNILPEGEAAFNFTFNSYKRSATKRGYEWAISREEFRILTQGNCQYCGIPPSTRYGACAAQRLNGVFIGNGIDRVENSVGYTLDNCVPCCKNCNFMKHESSLDDFKERVLRISTHLGLA